MRPGFTAAGGFGEAGMAGLTIRGESHRHSSGLWLGDKALKIARVSYSVVASGVHPSAKRTGAGNRPCRAEPGQ